MSKYVLIVDDEAAIRRIVALQLRRAGFQVESASDGQEALELIEEDRPDVVIADWQMPRMNGFELCKAMQAQAETRLIPVVLLTALGFEIRVEDFRCFENVVGFMTKPFSSEELVNQVENALRVELR